MNSLMSVARSPEERKHTLRELKRQVSSVIMIDEGEQYNIAAKKEWL